MLIFPTYYRRERPDLTGYPAVLVSYSFRGFRDDIYTTLVVRLHHTEPFEKDQLWRYAADFKTLTGRQLGIKLTRVSEGDCELEVYFDPAIPVEEKIFLAGMFTSTCCKRPRMSNAFASTCARTAAR